MEKSFAKNRGELDESMFNIPKDVNVERRPSELPREKSLNLWHPVMNKGAKAAAELNLNFVLAGHEQRSQSSGPVEFVTT